MSSTVLNRGLVFSLLQCNTLFRHVPSESCTNSFKMVHVFLKYKDLRKLQKVIAYIFVWTWKNFVYYMWHMKRLNIFTWLNFAMAYETLNKSGVITWHVIDLMRFNEISLPPMRGPRPDEVWVLMMWSVDIRHFLKGILTTHLCKTENAVRTLRPRNNMDSTLIGLANSRSLLYCIIKWGSGMRGGLPGDRGKGGLEL